MKIMSLNQYPFRVWECILGYNSSPSCAHAPCHVAFQFLPRKRQSMVSWLLAITYLALAKRCSSKPTRKGSYESLAFPLAIAMRRASPGSCQEPSAWAPEWTHGSPYLARPSAAPSITLSRNPSKPSLDQQTSSPTKTHDLSNYWLLYDANVLWSLWSNVTVPVTSHYPGWMSRWTWSSSRFPGT